MEIWSNIIDCTLYNLNDFKARPDNVSKAVLNESHVVKTIPKSVIFLQFLNSHLYKQMKYYE